MDVIIFIRGYFMKRENVSKIIIGDNRRLLVFLKNEDFEHIYRTASGVNWNNDKKYLFSQIPEEWDYVKWFNHILCTVLDEYGVLLKISRKTLFENINKNLENELKNPKNIRWQYESLRFVFNQEHKCPNCGRKIIAKKTYDIINSKSPEAKDYDFSAGDTFFIGDVLFIYHVFYCGYCNKKYKIKEIRNYEKSIREIEIMKMNGNKLLKEIKIMFNKLFYGMI
jgi:hypothetical protein